MGNTSLAVRITPLEQHHVREAFCCSEPRINTFLIDRSLQDHQGYKVRVFVATVDDDPKVLGFYSLQLSALASGKIMGKCKQKFGKRPIPAVYLSMVGVQEEYEGKKIGTQLMLHAFERTMTIADNAGTYCLYLDAVSEKRAAWYEQLQFTRIPSEPLVMYIPIQTIAAALA